MSQWSYVAVAYAVTLFGTVGLFGWSYETMRRAETAVDLLKRSA